MRAHTDIDRQTWFYLLHGLIGLSPSPQMRMAPLLNNIFEYLFSFVHFIWRFSIQTSNTEDFSFYFFDILLLYLHLFIIIIVIITVVRLSVKLMISYAA